jgi:spore coat protein CotH
MRVRWSRAHVLDSHMKQCISILFVFISAGVSLGVVIDPSSVVFDDRIVNDYRITFYQTQWDTMLAFNKDNDEVYMPARFRWRGPSGDSIVLDSIGVRYKGNSSYVFAGASFKKPYKISFNEYKKDQLFFGLEKLNFSNSVLDPSCMREKIAYDVLRKYMPSPRAAFATLTVEDSLVKAFYTQVEQVDELFLDRHFGGHKYNLYKAGDQGAYLTFKDYNQSSYLADYELKTNEKEDNWSGLIIMIDSLNNAPDADFVRIVGKHFDIDNCIRYLAFNMVNCNFDSYTGSGRNFYLYDDQKAGAFKLVPWDVNLSFGMYQYMWNVVTVDAFAPSPSNLNQRPLAKRILSDDSLKRVYAEYMEKMIAGPLNADSIGLVAHRLKAVIDSSVKSDVKKFYTYEQFCTNIDTEVVILEGTKRTILPGLKSFTAMRNANVSAQIEQMLPVDYRPKKRAASGAMQQCEYRALTKSLLLRYYVPMAPVRVAIRVYTADGVVVRSWSEGNSAQGVHTRRFDARGLSAGYYAIQLTVGKLSATAGIVLHN